MCIPRHFFGQVLIGHFPARASDRWACKTTMRRFVTCARANNWGGPLPHTRSQRPLNLVHQVKLHRTGKHFLHALLVRHHEVGGAESKFVSHLRRPRHRSRHRVEKAVPVTCRVHSTKGEMHVKREVVLHHELVKKVVVQEGLQLFVCLFVICGNCSIAPRAPICEKMIEHFFDELSRGQ